MTHCAFVFRCAHILTLLIFCACDREPRATTTRPEQVAASPQTATTQQTRPSPLKKLADKHSALLGWIREPPSDEDLLTVDLQDDLDAAQGKVVGLSGVLIDVYRVNGLYKAVFLSTELGFDGTIALRMNEKQGRSLITEAHSSKYPKEYAVTARVTGLHVSYVDQHRVAGEKGADLENLEVEHSGFEASRVIEGELIECMIGN